MHFVVTYTTFAAAKRDGASLALGAYLKTTEALPQFAPVEVELRLPDETHHTLAGEVVSVVAGSAIMVQWRTQSRDGVEQLLRAIQQAQAAPPGSAAADDPVVALATSDEADSELAAAAAADEAHAPKDTSLVAQIAAMSVNEKRQHAMQGKKDMRWLLARDTNKSIHPFVLRNPAITLDEVEQMTRLTAINPEVLHTVAQNRDWTRSPTVVRNVVRHPKTPLQDAVALLEKLPLAELRAIAKSPSVRAPLQQAARKKVATAGPG